jgi:hypothetical protein
LTGLTRDVTGICKPQCGVLEVWNGKFCICQTGAVRYGVCRQCPVGSQPNILNLICVCSAPNQIFSVVTFSCITCSANSLPNIAQTACVCTAGYTVNSIGTCDPTISCPINQIVNGNQCGCSNGYAINSNGGCSMCPLGSLPSVDQSKCLCGNNQMFNKINFTCVTCPANSAPSSDQLGCICNAGFNAVNNVCAPIQTCQGNLVLSGNQCVCPSNYAYDTNNVCTKCPSGTSASADQSKCICGSNQMFSKVSFTCLTCPANSIPSSDQLGCMCNAGFNVVNNACAPIQTCQVNQVLSGNLCVCISGFVYNINGACTKCPSGTSASTDQSKCICGPNQMWNKTTFACVLCPTNSVPTVDQLGCQCNAGFNIINNLCVSTQTCQANQVLSGSLCVCQPGFVFNINGVCTSCPMGSSPSADQSKCNCGPNQMWNKTTFSCVLCPGNSTPTFDQLSCQCNAGFNVINNSCVIISNCPQNQVMNGSLCVCQPGLVFNINGVCTSCPMGSSPSADQSKCNCGTNQMWNKTTFACVLCPTNSVPSFDQLSCQCNAGFNVINNICTPIQTCQLNQVLNGSLCVCIANFSYNNNGICTRCPTGSTSSTDQSKCICVSNQIFNTTTFTCLTCPSYSTPSSDQSSCICISGYTLINNVCIQIQTCQPNQVLNGTQCICASDSISNNNGGCSKCPNGVSSDKTKCICTNNQIFNMTSFTCSTCPGSFTASNYGCICDPYSNVIG